MRKLITQLLLMLIILNVKAKTEILTNTDNIATKLGLNNQYKWSVDGGVFQTIDSGIYLSESKDYNLLVMDLDNNIVQHTIKILSNKNSTVDENIIYVDNNGPEIIFEWQNINRSGDQITVGKNSQLSWSVSEELNSSKILINGQEKILNDNTIKFSKNDSSIRIEVLDYFDNKGSKSQILISDFKGPDINWMLNAPALKINDQWFAGNKASVQVSAKDNATIQGYFYKNKRIVNPLNIEVKNNSTIVVSDKFGNISSTKISWIQDKDKPVITVRTANRENINNKSSIKINEDVFVSVSDKGVGLKYAKFLNKKRRWESLPKTFNLLSRGSYSIRIRAEDILGNKLKTTFQLKAK